MLGFFPSLFGPEMFASKDRAGRLFSRQPADSPQPFSVIILILIQLEINKCCYLRSYSRCHNFANYEGHEQRHTQKIGAGQIGFRGLLPHVRLLYNIWETKFQSYMFHF